PPYSRRRGTASSALAPSIGCGRSTASARSGWPWRGDVRPRAFLSRMDGPSASRGRSSWSISATFMIVAAAVVLGLLLYYAQYSGSVQWGLGLVFLGVIAFLAWRQVLRGTAEPGPLVGPVSPETIRTGQLDALSGSMPRAARGWRRGDERRLRRGGERIHPRCRRAGDRRQAPGARARPLGGPRRRPPADRGRPRPREDVDRQVLRRGPRPGLPPDPIHAGPP